MKISTQKNEPKPALTIRVHATDGSIESFVQSDELSAKKTWDGIDPARLYAKARIIIASEHSKTVFVSNEILRIDFIQDGFACWKFPGGYSDIVELTASEFRQHVHLNEPALMAKREEPTPVGDLLVSFVRLQMRGSPPLYIMIEFPVKLPADNQSFMQFLLSKGSIHMRLPGGGIGVVNLANLAAYTVYPGVAQVPSDSWPAEPAPKQS